MYRLLDPNVWLALLDEPTANCDPETRVAFFNAVCGDAALRRATIVAAVHDPACLPLFDRVIRVDDGCVWPRNDPRDPTR
jgi:ABC-type lipoprotein export system ATPase subunit